MSVTEYSLILPCYNESKALPYLFEQYGSLALERAGTAGALEVIFVNNGSKDSTDQAFHELLEKHPQYKPCFRYAHEKINRGVGGGLKAGARAASGNWLIFSHADEQYGRASIEKIIALKESYHGHERVLFKGRRRGRSTREVFFSRCFDAVASMATGAVVFDINAQPKCFKAPRREFWDYAPDDYCIDLFVLATFKRSGGVVKSTEVPVRERLTGKSSWSRGYRGTMKLASSYIHFLRSADLKPSSEILVAGT